MQIFLQILFGPEQKGIHGRNGTIHNIGDFTVGESIVDF